MRGDHDLKPDLESCNKVSWDNYTGNKRKIENFYQDISLIKMSEIERRTLKNYKPSDV